MNVAAALQRRVEARAARRCEYCRMHQTLQGATFHVEHIVPRSRGGMSNLANVAWACPACNLHKADRVRVEVPEPGGTQSVPLFNPRTDHWSEHFAWRRHGLIGLTVVGRATVEALDLNHPRRILIRRAEEMFSLFPPED